MDRTHYVQALTLKLRQFVPGPAAAEGADEVDAGLQAAGLHGQSGLLDLQGRGLGR